MIGFAPAKINLGLFITGKRPDGFHALESCFWPVQWQDVLEVHKRPEPGLALRVSGIPIPGATDDNLIHRAYTLLHDRYSIGGVDAHLFKALPMGAGLGGGSSDAVCMLKLMNVLWDLNLTDEEGLELAALLGSDCPFFWFSQPSLVTGRGEHLSKMEVGFPGPLYVTIIHPGIHVSTRPHSRPSNPNSPTWIGTGYFIALSRNGSTSCAMILSRESHRRNPSSGTF